MYQNNGIVKKIDEVVKDKGTKVHTRKVITMDNGAMYFLDHYIEKPQAKPKSSSPKKFKSFPAAANSSHNNTPVKGSCSEHNAIPSKSGHSDTDSSASTLKKHNTSSISHPSESTDTGDDTDPKSRDQSNIPLSIIVYSEKDPNLGPPNPDQVRGIWTFHEEATFEDEELWQPQEIFLHKPGEDLSTIFEEDENGSVDTNCLTTGVWGYPKGGAPKIGSSEDDWFPTGGEALVVPPQQQAPDDFVPAGKYSFKPGTVSWPPPVDDIRKRLRDVGKLKVPKCFEDGKCPIKVFPRSKLPADRSPIKLSPVKKVSFAPIGQWSYPKDQMEDDDHFLPVNIDLYFGDKIPPTATSVVGSEDGSLLSWGLWGNTSSQASPLDVLDDDSSEASWELPVNSLIFPPGVEPDPDIEIQGRWAFPLSENVRIEWPPTVTKYATIFPKMFAPKVIPGKSQGVWDFEAIDEADKEEWDPQEVELFGCDKEFDDERPHGFWGILQGAEPNNNLDWKPEDVLFCPPGEVPDDDVWVQGKWAFPIEKGLNSWPPPPGAANKQRSVGKLKVPECFKGGNTVSMKVFPRSHMPNETHGKPIGKWSGPGKDDLDHLLPQDVELYYGDHEPDCPEEASEYDYGVWGMDESVVSDISDLNDEDDWTPNHSLVYPPGVLPEQGVRVCGKWAILGRKKIEWPPPLSKSAWVYPRSMAPASKRNQIQGVWKFVHDIEPEGSHKWSPQQIELYSTKESLDDTRPYGLWGIKVDATPDKHLNYGPKDVWFYPPGEAPEDDCEKRGIWTFPRCRLDVSWPPPAIESPQRKQRTVGKLKIPGTFDDKSSSRDEKNVGKLKIPSLFSGS
jgi:hypothetical protein